MFSPQELDRKSLALHQLVVEKIRREPALVALVRQNLDRLQSTAGYSTLPYYVEWQKAVDQSIDEALALATEDSERAQTMRQASPFAGVLSELERLAFLKSWSSRYEPA